MTAVAGLRGTGDWATDERPKSFRELILFRNPNGTTPLHALMAQVSSESVNDPEYSWWDEPNDIWRGQVNGALGTGDTTIVIDSADPSTSSPDNNWGLATHLVPGDILMVELGTSEDAAYSNEHLLVKQVIDANTIVVERAFAGSSAAAISDNAFLTKLGSAFAEGTGEAQASTRNPMKYFNYTQIFKTTYEMTRTASQTKTRTGDPVKNDKKRKVFDHSTKIEMQLMFGRRSEGVGDNGKPRRTTGGLRTFIPTSHQKVYSAAVSYHQFLDDIHPVFDYDTTAGDERIVLCGNGAMNELNKMADAAGQVKFDGTIKQYGMNLRKLMLPQGTLFVRTHPLMNRHGLYKNSMFILDMSALTWRHMLDTKSQDNIQLPGEDTKKGQWITEAGLEVAYGGLTQFYVGNFTAT